MIIREANINDVKKIKEITYEAFMKYCELVGIDPKNNAAVNETIDDIIKDIQNKKVFVADSDGKIIGSIRVEIINENSAYISRFGVSLTYQNNGVGKMLIEKVDKYLIENNIKKVYLHTASKLKDLIIFYYKRGFYIVSTSDEYGYIRALLCKEY